MQRRDDIKSITGFSVNDIKELLQDRKKWCSLAYNRMLSSKSGRISRSLREQHIYIYIYIYIYMCVCVCVCVCNKMTKNK